MSDAQYLAAIEAAKKFIEAAEAACAVRSTVAAYEYQGVLHESYEHMVIGTKECGTAKRASMDLTRQLAKFRKGQA